MRTVLSLVASLLLASCASQEVVEGDIARIEGKDVDWLISKWGYPDAEKTIAGKRLLVWQGGESTEVMPLSQKLYTTHTCHRVVELGSDNKVVKYQWDGNIRACMEVTKGL